ncbi:PREDICTED: proteasome assembly chaperone 2-like isoform X2 [Acromyrmex echinatior]|uniref:proteasome assembly chaperone 2-like isoform X2 n=1 Tax=Acromyrmex echinatior TaxID=103372 RepID=UPI000580FF0B|nr:PREDICTED: proteasome assembly chaperone 2-like isoform X2 [Acromyrmex echinatior]
MIKLTQDIDLENYTLILPSVAVGNVGQLSVDLLISNLNLPKVGQIFSTSFIPVVGANAYHEHSNELITAIDIYAGIKERIVVIQIRSPYVGELLEFFNEITQFVTERKIAKVIILASSHDYAKKEVQPQHLKLRYVASPSLQFQTDKLFDDLNWIPHKPKDVTGEERLQIPGGDNIEDAIALVCYLNQWICVLGTSSSNLKYPPSWKYLFGKPPSQDMY